MSQENFVTPKTDILTLPDGNTITVNRRLNYGQTRRAYERMSTSREDGSTTVRGLEVGIAKVLAYLVDWTLAEDGDPIVIKGKSPEELESILDNLYPDTFQDIRDAVDAHELKQAKARAAEKKSARTGGKASSPISVSPSGAAGALNGSENLTPTTMPSSLSS